MTPRYGLSLPNRGVLFGATTVDELSVWWPRSGTVQRFTNVKSDEVLQIREGDVALVTRAFPPAENVTQ